MKYKIGDIVIIKDELGADLALEVEELMQSLSPPRVVTIERVTGGRYGMEGMTWIFNDSQIEGLYKKEVSFIHPEKINERFKILDL